MNCTWVKNNLCDILDGLLPPDTEEQYQEHLADCAECRMLLAEIALDQQALTSLPRVSPPAELITGVLSAIRQPAKKALWPFFAPRFAPVAAALAIMVLGLNFWMAYFPHPSATRESALIETQMAPRLFVAGGEEPDSEAPAATDKRMGTASLDAASESALPERPSFLLVSSALGGSIFVVWGAIVLVWYKRS